MSKDSRRYAKTIRNNQLIDELFDELKQRAERAAKRAAERAAELKRLEVESRKRYLANHINELEVGEPDAIFIVTCNRSVRYGIDGGIVGIYDTERAAQDMCAALRAYDELYADERWYEDGPAHYAIVQAQKNCAPTNIINWHYYE